MSDKAKQAILFLKEKQKRFLLVSMRADRPG
jgi:hypothetical protein